ncbi:MAG: hypothetical protein IPL64_06450 [Flavobacteriales bacterium]|nr:hypothetical protein [Flavobacteriales bacterium]
MTTWSHVHMTNAIIDLGTNTFNLLVFQLGVAGLASHHSEERPVFLGRGGIEHGTLTDEAMERGMEALRAFKVLATAHGAERLHACVRDIGLRHAKMPNPPESCAPRSSAYSDPHHSR